MAPESVTLHTSWRGIVTSYAGAFIVLAAGALVVASVGFGVLPTVVLVAGVIFSLIVLFDYPIAVVFDVDGLTRRALLRHQRMRWSGIDQLSRSRPGLAGSRRLAHAGLVAVVGRRRYMLVDRCESPDEFAELERLLDPVDESILESVPRPHEAAAPTWLYRRARWAPEQPTDR